MITANVEDYCTGQKFIDNDLELRFSEKRFVTVPDADVIAYCFKMMNRNTADEMGDINIRAGYTENIIHYRGNIGFTVKEKYRGHHYSARSCILLISVIRLLGIVPVYITCNPENLGSKRNIESLGATFMEEATIPDDSPYSSFYPADSRIKLRYRWDL